MRTSSTISFIETPLSQPSPPPVTPTPLFSSYLAGDVRHLLHEAKSPAEMAVVRKKMQNLQLDQLEADLIETMARRRVTGR